jgi:hypothetical protein
LFCIIGTLLDANIYLTYMYKYADIYSHPGGRRFTIDILDQYKYVLLSMYPIIALELLLIGHTRVVELG